LKLIVLYIYGSPSASDHRLPKSLRISVASTVFTAYRYLIHDWFTWVFLLVGTDRQAAVLLWYFCHHEIPCLFHLKFYFLPGFSIKSLDVLLHGSVRLILRPLAGPLFCLYMYICPLVCYSMDYCPCLKICSCSMCCKNSSLWFFPL